MIPHVAPPVYPDSVRSARFAATIVRNAPELREHRESAELVRKCSVALLGIPDDTGVELNHGRPGAVQGPHALRQALVRYGAASPMDEADNAPPFPRVFDAGDVVPTQDLEETHDRVSAAVTALLDMCMFPIAIGGGHDLTWAVVRAVSKRVGPMVGVYLDAHLDVRPELGSGMSFRRLLESGHASKLYCVGADPMSNSREHGAYFASRGCVVGGFDPARNWPDGAAQFVSLDMDVLDMAFAPGVSAMNPCGMTPAEVGKYIDAAGSDPRVKCFDIMELSPPNDEHGRTARLAAHLLLRFLRAFSSRGSGG